MTTGRKGERGGGETCVMRVLHFCCRTCIILSFSSTRKTPNVSEYENSVETGKILLNLRSVD